MAQFRLDMKLYSYGWLRTVVTNRSQELARDISYLTDAPRDLADAVLSLLRSPALESAACSWEVEPGEYRWLFHRTNAGVMIEILWFQDCFPRLPNERGKRMFRAECSLLRLATQVKGQLHRLLNEHGEQGYATRWKHPFPLETFEQLEEYINILKHPSPSSNE